MIDKILIEQIVTDGLDLKNARYGINYDDTFSVSDKGKGLLVVQIELGEVKPVSESIVMEVVREIDKHIPNSKPSLKFSVLYPPDSKPRVCLQFFVDPDEWCSLSSSLDILRCSVMRDV